MCLGSNQIKKLIRIMIIIIEPMLERRLMAALFASNPQNRLRYVGMLHLM
jgi:hypothetical protein